jgi:phosphoribosyl 1,2-cyclic phosphodiesterase
MRFTVLASGSAGNASVLQSGPSALLIDAGLNRTLLTGRLEEAGLSQAPLSAVVLTHTHSDHWNDSALNWLAGRSLTLFCHPSHHTVLSRSAAFRTMLEAGLVRPYTTGEAFEPCPGVRATPSPVRHDGGATFAFRFEGPADLFGSAPVLGLATDLGVWEEPLAELFADVDLLAVEFNHDIGMEKRSQRPAYLIERVLGDHGHLSNCQAAAFLRAVASRGSGRLRHVVQLHLSNDCNRPALAKQAAKDALTEMGVEARVHTAAQHAPLKTINVSAGWARGRSPRPATPRAAQSLLPGLDG